jgi:lipopolysaccharide biosynthesis protein
LFLENRDIKFPFCLSWANETWSRRWDGRDHHILIQQTHPPLKDRWKLHFDYLIRAWSDPRAITIQGRPVFVIYRPHRINGIADMIDYWRELAQRAGLKGLYLIAQKQYEFPNRDCLKPFDGIFQFQPFEAIYSPGFDKNSIRQSRWFSFVRALPERIQDLLRSVQANFIKGTTFYDYDTVWAHMNRIRREAGLDTFPGAFADWDNSARYKNRATIFRGANPEAFREWFGALVAGMPQRQLPESFIFFNAWNEWSEGTYLEPDMRFGYRYLEAIRDVLTPAESQRACR